MGLGVQKPPFVRAEKAEKADELSQIWLQVRVWSLVGTRQRYLISFSVKTLKKTMFQHAFPLVKLAKAAPCLHEMSGFITFFVRPFAGHANWHFSAFLALLLETHRMANPSGFAGFRAS